MVQPKLLFNVKNLAHQHGCRGNTGGRWTEDSCIPLRYMLYVMECNVILYFKLA